MLDDIGRRELVLEYFKRLNAGDVDRILDLFAENATIEDPIGYGLKQGRPVLRQHFAFNVENAKVQDTVEKVVVAPDGRHVAAALTVEAVNFLNPTSTEPVRVDAILTFGIGGEGLIEELRCFWSFSDFEVSGS